MVGVQERVEESRNLSQYLYSDASHSRKRDSGHRRDQRVSIVDCA